MKQERVLRILILSEFVLGVLATISYRILEPSLPVPLRVYTTEAFHLYEILLTSLWIAVVVTTFISWIGLLNLLRPARSIYLASWVGYFVLLLLDGRVVSAWGAFVIEMMTALVGGAIMAMIYFSELAAKFRPLSELLSEGGENAA
jgi:hypothetical protein